LILAGLLAAACGQREWVEVEPAVGGFRFEVPAPPKPAGRSFETSAGTAQTHAWLHQTEERGFLVGFTDYPPAFGEHFGSAELLDGARDRAAERAGGRLTREEAVSIQGFPGRTVEIEAPGVEVRGHLLLADDRLYYVLATFRPGEAEAADVVRFLDSFRLVQ
jgi:hypothetical protein